MICLAVALASASVLLLDHFVLAGLYHANAHPVTWSHVTCVCQQSLSS